MPGHPCCCEQEDLCLLSASELQAVFDDAPSSYQVAISGGAIFSPLTGGCTPPENAACVDCAPYRGTWTGNLLAGSPRYTEDFTTCGITATYSVPVNFWVDLYQYSCFGGTWGRVEKCQYRIGSCGLTIRYLQHKPPWVHQWDKRIQYTFGFGYLEENCNLSFVVDHIWQHTDQTITYGPEEIWQQASGFVLPPQGTPPCSCEGSDPMDCFLL